MELQGLRKGVQWQDCRRPVSLALLHQLMLVLPQLWVSEFEAGLFGLAFSLAFFGAMRIGELVSKSDIPSAPKNVHFELDFFSHVLQWSAGEPGVEGVLYDVEYLIYGSELWRAVPHCTLTGNLSCDLTVETLPMTKGYFGKVRSILGNKTSEWVRTTRYTHKEVTLPPPSISFHVDGSSLFVHLSLPKIQNRNLTLHYEDIFPDNRLYNIQVRRTEDNHTFEQVEDVLTFRIANVNAGKEYCVSVRSSVTSRGNIGIRSPESCIYLPEEELDSSVLLVVASCSLVFLVFLIFANIVICLYVRGTVRTPKSLKSLIKRSWSWMEKPATPTVVCNDPFFLGNDQFLVEHRNSPMCSSADSGFGSQILSQKDSQPHPASLVPLSDDSGIDVPGSGSDLRVTSQDVVKTDIWNNPEIQGEDSGISLSTGSPCLKRSCSIVHTSCEEEIQDFKTQGSRDGCSCEIVEDTRLGYRRQTEHKLIKNSSDVEDTDNTGNNDYFTQRNPELHKDNVLTDPQVKYGECQGPWTQTLENFHSSIPLTVMFNTFNQELWDFGLNGPSLGDVQLMDMRS
ncbi:interleukin-10 receptor subunit alpha [Rhinophrynus dorsalis]